MLLVRLGFWNLLRNKLRTALSVLVITSGVYVLIAGQGMIGGLTLNIVMTQVNTVSGHVALQPEGYPNEPMSHPIDKLIEVDETTASWLDANTDGWTERILFSPEAIFGADGIRVKAIGYTETDEAVFSRDSWMVEGTIPIHPKDGVLMATGPAELLGVKAGDFVVLKVRTHKGALNAMSVPIAGVVTTNSPITDSQAVYVPWALAQQLVQNGDKTSHVNIRLRSRHDSVSVGQQLTGYPVAQRDLEEDAVPAKTMVPGATFETWESATRALLNIQEIRQKSLNFITFILLGVAAFGIANTILMAAYERIREVGTLRAMGMTRQMVLRMFVIEGAMLGSMGGLFGVLIGGAQVYHYSTVGLDLSEALKNGGDANNNMPFSAILYFEFDPMMLVGGFLFALIMATVASLYPAIVASQMVPADAVRA